MKTSGVIYDSPVTDSLLNNIAQKVFSRYSVKLLSIKVIKKKHTHTTYCVFYGLCNFTYCPLLRRCKKKKKKKME